MNAFSDMATAAEPHGGWVKLWRCGRNNPWLRDAVQRAVFTTLLMDAAFESRSRNIPGVGRLLLERGQALMTERALGLELAVGRQVIRRAMNNLKSGGLITTSPTRYVTVVTICNFDKYQSHPTHHPTRADNHHLGQSQPTDQPTASDNPLISLGEQQPKKEERTLRKESKNLPPPYPPLGGAVVFGGIAQSLVCQAPEAPAAPEPAEPHPPEPEPVASPSPKAANGAQAPGKPQDGRGDLFRYNPTGNPTTAADGAFPAEETGKKPAALPPGFEKWWADSWVPPLRRIGKGAAARAYAKARKRGATAQDLADGAAQYARWVPLERERRPTYDPCHPTTWLNQDRHLDELTLTSTNGSTKPMKSNGYLEAAPWTLA